MDLNDYWQENKRFVTCVAGGLVVFLIALLVIDSTYADEITGTRSRIAKLKGDLKKPMFPAADLRRAEEENEALASAVDALETAAAFQPRDEFRLDPSLGSSSNQYLRALSRVREEILPRANRANLALDAGLGMPKLSPTREEEIVRYLEALDVIDATVRLAVDAGVARVDKILIKLDNKLNTREGLGRIERTRVQFSLSGSSVALARVLAWTQRPRDGRVLHLDEVEMVQTRNKEDEIRMDLTLLVARLTPVVEEEV